MPNIVVGNPIAFAPNLYIDGLGISPGATTLLLTVGTGAARDSTNQDDIIVSTALTINGAANGANGLDTGALAANTFYYVYVIGSSLSANPEIDIDKQVSTLANGSIILNGTVVAEGQVTQPTWTVQNNPQPAGLISLSATDPVLPAGYDMFRRIGSVLTSAGSVFLPFYQEAGVNGYRRVWYDTPVDILAAAAAAAFTTQSLAAAVPATALGGTSTEVNLQVALVPNAAGDFAAFRPTGSASATGNALVSGDVAAVEHLDQITVQAALAAGVASIQWKTDAASTLAFSVSSYIDKV